MVAPQRSGLEGHRGVEEDVERTSRYLGGVRRVVWKSGCAGVSPAVQSTCVRTTAGHMNQDIRFCTTADGVRLAYAVSGVGSPLVMSATWLTHLEHQWRSLAWRPWLDAFTGEHKLLRYDSRGCGLSDRDVGDLSFETWVRDFECVIEAAAFPRFALVATCQGGPIAIEYAARHPERVSHLVLYGTYALGRLRWTESAERGRKGTGVARSHAVRLGTGESCFPAGMGLALPAWRHTGPFALLVRPAARSNLRRYGGTPASDRLERRRALRRTQDQMSRPDHASRARCGRTDRARPIAREPHSRFPLRPARQRKPYAARGRAGVAAVAHRGAQLSRGAE